MNRAILLQQVFLNVCLSGCRYYVKQESPAVADKPARIASPDGEEVMKSFFVLIQYRRVTDGQTDRHVAVAKTRASIALA